MILPPYIPIGCSPVWLGDMQLFMVMVPIQQLVVSPGVVVEVPFGPLTWWMEVTLGPVFSNKVLADCHPINKIIDQ